MNHLLAAVARHWRVPETLFDPGTLPRVAVATALLSDRVRRLVLQSRITTADFRRSPRCQSHPVPAVICERPLLDEAGFTDRWLRNGLDVALLHGRPNPVFQIYGRLLVEFAAEFCRLVGLLPPQIAEGWIFDRLRQPRYILYADVQDSECDSLTFGEFVARVPIVKRPFLDPRGFICRMPSSKKGRPTLDAKLAQELRERLTTGGVLDPHVIQAGILAVEDAILADLEAFASAGFSKRIEERERTFFGTWGAAHFEGVRHYRSAVPVPSGLGAADVELVVASAKRDLAGPFNHVAEALLIGCAAWHPPYELATLEVTGDLVASRLCRREPPREVILHRQTGDKFWRPLPPELIQMLLDIQRAGPPSEEEINRYLMGLRPWLTWAGIREALVTVAPAVWKYPAVLPMLGFYAPDRHSPVARSYIRIDWRYIELTECWLQLFDRKFQLPQQPSHFEACGSPNVPVTSELTVFGEAVNWMLRAELPRVVDAAVVRVNALAAGIFLLGPVLLGGVRNWPMRDVDLTRASIGWQKGPIFYEPPLFIREVLPLWIHKVDELCRHCSSAGLDVDRIGIRAVGLSLLRLEDDCLRSVPFSQRAVTEALVLEERTRRWSGLFPGAMRHYSMTELYAAGCDEHEVERFHHRAPSALNPFCVHRLEPITDRDGRSGLEEHLRKSLSSCTG